MCDEAGAYGAGLTAGDYDGYGRGLRDADLGWVTLAAADGKLIHVEDGWLIRRTYIVGQPGETVERYVPYVLDGEGPL